MVTIPAGEALMEISADGLAMVGTVVFSQPVQAREAQLTIVRATVDVLIVDDGPCAGTYIRERQPVRAKRVAA